MDLRVESSTRDGVAGSPMRVNCWPVAPYLWSSPPLSPALLSSCRNTSGLDDRGAVAHWSGDNNPHRALNFSLPIHRRPARSPTCQAPRAGTTHLGFAAAAQRVQ